MYISCSDKKNVQVTKRQIFKIATINVIIIEAGDHMHERTKFKG